jgi:hypothetical protein
MVLVFQSESRVHGGGVENEVAQRKVLDLVSESVTQKPPCDRILSREGRLAEK